MGNITTKTENALITFDENQSHFYYGQVSQKTGKPNGKGKYHLEDGSVYYGEFKNNTFNGFGTLYYANSDNMYKGNFKNNAREGKGELLYGNGDKYIGNFELDEPHGKGVYIYKNGCYYDGEFVLGMACGYGKVFDQLNNITFEGEFAKNKKCGFGISYKNSIPSYIGNWFNDKPHGVGLVFDTNYKLLACGVFEEEELMYELDYIPESLKKYMEYMSEFCDIELISPDKEIDNNSYTDEQLSINVHDIQIENNKNSKNIERVSFNPLHIRKNNPLTLSIIENKIEKQLENYNINNQNKSTTTKLTNPLYPFINQIPNNYSKASAPPASPITDNPLNILDK